MFASDNEQHVFRSKLL